MAEIPEKPVTLQGFPLGIDNRREEQDLEPGSARDLLNVDLTRDGSTLLRDGQTLRISGTVTHSLWSHFDLDYALAVKDGYIVRIDKDFTSTNIHAVNTHAHMSYALFAGEVYYSNGFENGVIVNGTSRKPWGLPDPEAPFATSTTSGGMHSGDYLVTYVYLNTSGQKSGTNLYTVVTVPENGGIQLTNIPSPPDVATIRVFVSKHDGDILYQGYDLPAGVYSTYNITKKLRGEPLDTEDCYRPPVGNIVRAYNARLYVAADTVLYYTLPGHPHLHRAFDGYFSFPNAPITVVEPVEDGIYVCAGKRTYFFIGDDPENMRQTLAASEGAVFGTGGQIPTNVLGGPEVQATQTAAWVGTETGLCIGRQSGVISRVTEQRVSIPEYTDGTLAYREHNGLKQIIMILREAIGVTNAAASDVAVGEIVRHGITIV